MAKEAGGAQVCEKPTEGIHPVISEETQNMLMCLEKLKSG